MRRLSERLLSEGAAGGLRLALWDLGIPGQKVGTTVLLVHGASLNALCWLPVADGLARDGLHPVALDLRGHGASGRSPQGDYGWEGFADDVLAAAEGLISGGHELGLEMSLEVGLEMGLEMGEADEKAPLPVTADGQGLPGEVTSVGSLVRRRRPGDRPSAVAGYRPRLVGAGHSAGATALLLAEARQPGTFAALWAWEPIMDVPTRDLRRERSRELAERARRRRSQFSSLEDARAHLEGRGIFAEFSPAAFEGFLQSALVPSRSADGGDGCVLACDPEDEARTYEASGSHAAWDELALVRCPTKVVGGELSPAVPPAEVLAIAGRLPAGEGATLPGLGHFGPFQAPGEVATDLARWAMASPGPSR